MRRNVRVPDLPANRASSGRVEALHVADAAAEKASRSPIWPVEQDAAGPGQAGIAVASASELCPNQGPSASPVKLYAECQRGRSDR